MSINSPFKFLDSYSKEDENIFFGREEEIEELYARVFRSKITVLFGASGTGKSSIINCGLANKFSDADWLPIHIRRGHNIVDSVLENMLVYSNSEILVDTNSSTQAENISNVAQAVFLDQFKPIFLIFDQFEELFILGDRKEWNLFIDSIKELIDQDIDLHLIFVLRGEYLEYLSEFEAAIPDFMSNRQRVERMTTAKVVACVEGPCNVAGIDLEPGFTTALIEKVSGGKSELELTFLQVYLDKIFQAAKGQAAKDDRLVFTLDILENIGDIGDILDDFVEEQISEMNDKTAALSILKAFVTTEGTKVQRTPEEAREIGESLGYKFQNNQARNLILKLTNRRILVEKENTGKFELRHDSLAKVIHDRITLEERELMEVKQLLNHGYQEFKKRGVLLSQADVIYVERYSDRLNLSWSLKNFLDKSSQNSRRQKQLRLLRLGAISIISILLMLSIYAYFYSQEQKTKAEVLAVQAEKQRKLAEEQKIIAEQSSEEAQKQAVIAEMERQRALVAQNEAEQQRQQAIYQEKIATEQASLAREAEQLAVENAAVAREQEARAKEVAEAARRLRMLALAKNVALKSSQISNKELKGLLALQANRINEEFEGNVFEPSVYNALYEAYKSFEGDQFNVVRNHEGAVRELMVQDKILLSTGSDGKIIEWALFSGTPSERKTFSSGKIIRTMDSSPDNSKIVVGTKDGFIQVLYKDNNDVALSFKAHENDINGIHITSNENIASVGIDGFLKWHDMQGNEINSVHLSQKITSLDALPSMDKVYVGLENGDVIEYHLDGEAQLLYSGKSPASIITHHPGNSILLMGFEDGETLLYNSEDQEIIRHLVGHISKVTDASFGTSGNFLVTGSMDRSARLWVMDQPDSPPIVIDDLENWVVAVEVDDLYGRVLVGDYSGNLKYYDLNTSRFMNGMCQKIGRGLTQAEWNEYIGSEIPIENICGTIKSSSNE